MFDKLPFKVKKSPKDISILSEKRYTKATQYLSKQRIYPLKSLDIVPESFIHIKEKINAASKAF